MCTLNNDIAVIMTAERRMLEAFKTKRANMDRKQKVQYSSTVLYRTVYCDFGMRVRLPSIGKPEDIVKEVSCFCNLHLRTVTRTSYLISWKSTSVAWRYKPHPTRVKQERTGSHKVFGLLALDDAMLHSLVVAVRFQ